MAKNSIFLYLRMGLVMLVSLFSVRILLKALGVDDYGVYMAIAGVVSSLAFLSTLLANASQRFCAYAIGQNNITALNQNVGTIQLVYIVIVVFLFLAGETVGIWFIENKMNYAPDKSSSVFWVFQFSLFTLMLNLLSAPFLALLLAHEDMKTYAFISISEAILKLGAAFLLSYFTFSRIIIYPLFLCIISIFILVIYIITIKRKYPYVNIKPQYQATTFRTVLSFIGWSSFGAFAGVAYNQGINILFNLFIGPLANAAFAIANQVSASVTTFGTSFFSAVRPGMIKCYAQNEFKKLFDLFTFSNKLVFILLYIVILPLFINMNTILEIWLGESGPYMVEFTRLLLIACMISFLGLPITTIVQASGKVRGYHIFVDGFLAVSIVFIYLLFRSHSSSESILWGVNTMYTITYCLRLVYFKRMTNFSLLSFVRNFHLPMMFIIAISGVTVYLLSTVITFSPLIDLLLSTLESTSIILLLSFIFLLNKDDRKKLQSLLKK